MTCNDDITFSIVLGNGRNNYKLLYGHAERDARPQRWSTRWYHIEAYRPLLQDSGGLFNRRVVPLLIAYLSRRAVARS